MGSTSAITCAPSCSSFSGHSGSSIWPVLLRQALMVLDDLCWPVLIRCPLTHPQEQQNCNSGDLAMTPFGPLGYIADPSNKVIGVATCTQYFSLMWCVDTRILMRNGISSECVLLAVGGRSSCSFSLFLDLPFCGLLPSGTSPASPRLSCTSTSCPLSRCSTSPTRSSTRESRTICITTSTQLPILEPD